MNESSPIPEAPAAAKPFPHIILQIPDDPKTRKALEHAAFDGKFIYSAVKSKNPNIHPDPGKVFYRIYYTDPLQLFHLGMAFQSILNQQ